jgi:hypothetical protein
MCSGCFGLRFEQFFPFILMLLSLCSSVAYWTVGDWRMGLYWIFAAGLTAMVTF